MRCQVGKGADYPNTGTAPPELASICLHAGVAIEKDAEVNHLGAKQPFLGQDLDTVSIHKTSSRSRQTPNDWIWLLRSESKSFGLGDLYGSCAFQDIKNDCESFH